MYNQDPNRSKQLMNLENLRELDLKILEVCSGASLSAIIPMKVLIFHLISVGLIDKNIIAEAFKNGLSTQRYDGEIKAMISPIWAALVEEVENCEIRDDKR